MRRLPSASRSPSPSRRPITSSARSRACAVAELQPRRVEQTALDAFHGKGDRAAGADRVEPQLVAPPRRPQHDVRIARCRTAGRARTGFRIPAARPAAVAIAVRRGRRYARSRSCRRRNWRGSSRASAVSCSGERAAAAGKRSLLKIARRQAPRRLKTSRLAAVPSSRYLAVAGPNDLSESCLASATSSAGWAQARALRAANGDGLDVLRAQHRAAAAAAGVPAVVRDRGIAHQPLAGRADRGDLKFGAQAGSRNRLSASPAGQAPQIAGRLEPHLPSSMTSTDGSSAPGRRARCASQPVRLPAMAKWLLASESLIRSVSGLLLTTANLAEVVSGLPTSGLNTNASGAAGDSGSTRRRALRAAASKRPSRCRPGSAAASASASGTPARRRGVRHRSTRR